VERHGPIDSVTAERVEKGDGPPPLKTCPNCHDMIPLAAAVCPSCGHAFPAAEPRKLNHGLKASDRDPLGGVHRYRVLGVAYRRHAKLGRPDSMRVIYHVAPPDAEGEMARALQERVFSEWVCFEHPGYARARAESWAHRRGVAPAPKTVAEALAAPFAKPVSIVVNENGKYPEVVHHEF